MITFNKIENREIFTRDFRPLVNNNTIDFPTTEEIAVVYGPNGTGKTSLINALAGEKDTKIEFEYEGHVYTTGKDVFHIINDQNNRNIIKGETKDFFLGDNIKREFELQEFIAVERAKIIASMVSMLKANGISAANSPLISFVVSPDLSTLIKDIANSKSKGNNHSTEELIEKLQSINISTLPEYEDAKLQFIKNDYASKTPITEKIEQLNAQPLTVSPHIHEIEENTEAISILTRFQKEQCIVCDTNGIDWEALLAAKTQNRATVIEELDESIKGLIEDAIALVPVNDPFEIKTNLIEAISDGNNTRILILLDSIAAYKALYNQLVLNDLAAIIADSDLPAKMIEYKVLLDETPEITEEDMVYIEEIISSSMRKSLTLERDGRKNLKIRLSDHEFLGKTRDELPLSTGE